MRASILLLLTFLVSTLRGQDVLPSQFYASPVLLNPALTGKLKCHTIRGILLYRNLSGISPAPNQTYTAAFDAKVISHHGSKSELGLGVLATNEIANNNGELGNYAAGASVGYHYLIGEKHSISLGAQGTYITRNIDLFSLHYANQIGPSGPFLSMWPPPGPIIESNRNANINAGIHWQSDWEKFGFEIGGSISNILSETLVLSGSQTYTLGPRYTGHAKADIRISDLVSLEPTALFSSRNSIQRVDFGSAVYITLGKVDLKVGIGNRMVGGIMGLQHDALWALYAMEYEGFFIGLSTEGGTGGMTDANGGYRGFELSLGYKYCPSQKAVASVPKF